MDIQSMGPSSKVESLSLSAGSSVWRRSFSRCVGSLPLGGLDDGWALVLWDEGPKTEMVHARTEMVHARTERVQSVL